MIDKAHILNELKRVTDSGNGVVPGQQKFFNETGIKQSDWYGKFWARWSDAVKEAGYSPNQLQKSYSHIFLLENLLALTRELGQFPTRGDLRLKAKTDSSFPSHNTFGNLGSKKEIIRKLIEFCEQHGNLEDVAEICKPLVSVAEPRQSVQEISEDFGYVYLMKSGRFYKIGKSSSVGRRHYELSIQLPEKLSVVHKLITDDPSGIESYWHKRFESKRKNGEWFELSQQDIKAFKRRKFM